MKCPACDHDLRPLKAGALTLDVCQGGCGGLWFDAFELSKLNQQAGVRSPIELRIARDEQRPVDAERKRRCPKCAEVFLLRHFMTRKREVEVDECPGCGGFWLDAGELSRLRMEKEQVAKEDAAKAARLPANLPERGAQRRASEAFLGRLSIRYSARI